MEKKEAAKVLFDLRIPQKEIAAVLHTTEKSVSNWATKGNWEEKRAENGLQRETAEEKVWRIINFNLTILDMIREKQLVKLSPDLSIEELTKMLTDRGDIDALQKLFTTIKGKELQWTAIVKIVREVTEYLEGHQIELAKKMVPVLQSYLNEKRQHL